MNKKNIDKEIKTTRDLIRNIEMNSKVLKKEQLTNSQKYLLAVRDNYKKQKSDGFGVEKYYKKGFYLNNISHNRVRV
tara:strand:+ start:154 stop:384 length:231 start_codon:yes stop_codon:yes gene_type:complete